MSELVKTTRKPPDDLDQNVRWQCGDKKALERLNGSQGGSKAGEHCLTLLKG